MKTTNTLLLLFCCYLMQASNSTFQKLCRVNPLWLQQKDVDPNAITQNLTLSEHEWIRFHLMSVEKTLRNREVDQLSFTQKQNREKCLDHLHKYWSEGNFPINEDYNYRTPIFIDKHDNFCAVGYLVKASGHEDISRMISSKTNLAYVHEIKYPELFSWADENGLSVDELAWIQPAYAPPTIYDDLNGGLNGDVNSIVIDSTTNALFAGGSFSQSTKGTLCNNIAVWTNSITGWDWSNLGGGLNGPVQTLLIQNNQLYAGGDFTMAGNIPIGHIAIYDLFIDQWLPLGSLDGTVRTIAVYNGEIYAGGDFTGNVAKWNGTSWQSIAQGTLSGSVRTLEVWNGLLVIGGKFDLVNNAPRKNVIAYNGTQMVLMGMGTLTPVNDFEYFDGKLLAGCDFAAGIDTCAIASYDGSNWQVYLHPPGANNSSYLHGNYIKKMIARDSSILVAGDFDCSIDLGVGGSGGKNLMQYFPLLNLSFGSSTLTLHNLCAPAAYLDGATNTLALQDTNYFFGGSFSFYDHDSPMEPLNHIASRSSFPTGIRDLMEEKMNVAVYPNPAPQNASVEVTATKDFASISLFDISGRKISEIACNTNYTTLSMAGLAKGYYLLQLSGRENIKTVKKIIIQ